MAHLVLYDPNTKQLMALYHHDDTFSYQVPGHTALLVQEDEVDWDNVANNPQHYTVEEVLGGVTLRTIVNTTENSYDKHKNIEVL